MSTLFPDTRPEAEQVLFELLRQAPSWRKLEMLAQMNQAAQTLALSGLRQRHPEATPQELHRRLADLLLGTTLAEQVYGPLAIQEQPDAAEPVLGIIQVQADRLDLDYLRHWAVELGVADLLEKALTTE